MLPSLMGVVIANVVCREGRQGAADSKGDTEAELVSHLKHADTTIERK